MTLRQWLCGLNGHLEITKRENKRIQRQCFVCQAAIGPGMDFTGPAERIETRYPLKSRFLNFDDWAAVYDPQEPA